MSRLHNIDATLQKLLDEYKALHPIRTADFHVDCNCLRCVMDQVEVYLREKKSKSGIDPV